jgi:hypothetical protein
MPAGLMTHMKAVVIMVRARGGFESLLKSNPQLPALLLWYARLIPYTEPCSPKPVLTMPASAPCSHDSVSYCEPPPRHFLCAIHPARYLHYRHHLCLQIY